MHRPAKTSAKDKGFNPDLPRPKAPRRSDNAVREEQFGKHRRVKIRTYADGTARVFVRDSYRPKQLHIMQPAWVFMCQTDQETALGMAGALAPMIDRLCDAVGIIPTIKGPAGDEAGG